METINPEGPFSNRLWEAIQSIYKELINHPFVNKLAEGTLAPSSFAHYLSQDILYISEDAKALEKLSEKAILDTDKHFFKALANDGIAVEQELHKHFLKHFKLVEARDKSPIIQNYTTFLLQHSEKSSYCIAAAALLPCYWIYYMLGEYIVSNALENNRYQKWIDTYQGNEFRYYTKTYIQIVERLAKTASDIEKEQMQIAYIEAVNFELSFFNEAITM